MRKPPELMEMAGVDLENPETIRRAVEYLSLIHIWVDFEDAGTIRGVVDHVGRIVDEVESLF